MRIFAQIIAYITRHPREIKHFADFQFPRDMWVHNLFRLYEIIFGRRAGIRLEMSAWADKNGNQGKFFYTWECLLSNTEAMIRRFFREFKFVPIKILVPAFSNTGFRSPFLFAIAWQMENDNGGNTASLTVSAITVASTNTLVVSAATYLAASNNPITGVTFNTSENLTQLINQFFNAGSRITEDLWQIAAPSATTADVVISSAGTNMYGNADVYSGASTSGLITNTASNTGTGTAGTCTLTGTASSSWAIGGHTTDNATPTSGTGWTVRTTHGWPPLGDSNGTTGGGSFTMNSVIGASSGWVFVGGELTVSGGGATPIRSRMLSGIGQ